MDLVDVSPKKVCKWQKDHLRRNSTSLFIRKMQTKAMMSSWAACSLECLLLLNIKVNFFLKKENSGDGRM